MMNSSLRVGFVGLLGSLLIVSCAAVSGQQASVVGLKERYYEKSCPKAEQIIATMMERFIRKDVNVSAGIIRMMFHDCFVRGCDASVLLASKAGNTAEKDAQPNLSLQGFTIIDQIKSVLESECPGVVSCADIIVFAARECVFHGGIKHRYGVRGGRKDGKISKATEAVRNLPLPTANMSTLVKMFAAKGLSAQDMVTLSGAHSIGVSHCSSLAGRQFNQDPSLDPRYAAKLRQVCPKKAKTDPELFMDAFTPTTLDNKYYWGVLQHKGLFTSDATLLTDPFTKKQVLTNAHDSPSWEKKFVAAMIKMGETEVKTGGSQGEVRLKCSVVNKK